MQKLKDLERADGNLEILKSGNSKYLFKNLFELYIEQKQKMGLTADSLHRTKLICHKYLLPSLANRDAKDIKYSDLCEILNAIYNPHNPKSRLEIAYRLTGYLKNIFDIAVKDDYIFKNPSLGLKDILPTKSQFNRTNEHDPRYPALTKSEDLREFIKDLKCDGRFDLQTKRAIYLQILTANRPINTASAKWAYIDFEKKIWTIPANEMKMRIQHEIPLTERMIKILQEQRLFSGDLSEFVFPSGNKDGHLHRDTLSKAIRNLGGSDKWRGKATSHGFRATFKTICSENEAELLQMGISEKVVESALAHNEFSTVVGYYERSKAKIEQKRTLLQWYEDLGLPTAR